MEYKQVKSINIEGVAFLAQDMPTHTLFMPTHQDVHSSGYSCGAVEFNKNVQREITGNTTQYYQNTTKGFEFTDANFKIKHSLKLQREISEKVSYNYLSCLHYTYSSGCTYL